MEKLYICLDKELKKIRKNNRSLFIPNNKCFLNKASKKNYKVNQKLIIISIKTQIRIISTIMISLIMKMMKKIFCKKF